MILPILTIICWIFVAVPLVALGYFSAEVLCGLFPQRAVNNPNAQAKAAILIPAHNEALGISETLTRLEQVIPQGTRVLVVADNCQDNTADVARKCGVEVVERSNTAQRGKGFALAFGRDHLANGPLDVVPDVVIVLDADCQLAPGSVEALCAAVMANGRPAQAVDLIEAVPGASPLVQVSSFAMLVKNLVRLRGLGRLGGCSLLCGTGMAFAWRDFAQADLATGNVVEDLGLAIAMIRTGIRPQLSEGATVTSRPPGEEESVAQRSRWEHGFMDTATKKALPTLFGGIVRMRRSEIALGLHLLVPPLALLLLVSAALWLVLVGIALLSGIWAPAITLASALAAALFATLLAWLIEGRATLSATALARIPLYVLWKVPIYLKFFRKRETNWVRTKREGE